MEIPGASVLVSALHPIVKRIEKGKDDRPASKQSPALGLTFFYAQHRLPREYVHDAVPEYVESNNAGEIVTACLVDGGEINKPRLGCVKGEIADPNGIR